MFPSDGLLHVPLSIVLNYLASILSVESYLAINSLVHGAWSCLIINAVAVMLPPLALLRFIEYNTGSEDEGEYLRIVTTTIRSNHLCGGNLQGIAREDSAKLREMLS